MPEPDEDLELAPGVVLRPAEVSWRYSTSRGPGGQHVNTSRTRVEAVFSIADSPSIEPRARDRLVARIGPTVRVVAQDERSQRRNRDVAFSRLADRLRAALVEPTQRRRTRPTRASVERRLEDKRRTGRRKRERSRGEERLDDPRSLE